MEIEKEEIKIENDYIQKLVNKICKIVDKRKIEGGIEYRVRYDDKYLLDDNWLLYSYLNKNSRVKELVKQYEIDNRKQDQRTIKKKEIDKKEKKRIYFSEKYPKNQEVSRIISINYIENILCCLVEWKPNSTGLIFKDCFIPIDDIKFRYPNELLHFYEKKFKFKLNK